MIADSSVYLIFTLHSWMPFRSFRCQCSGSIPKLFFDISICTSACAYRRDCNQNKVKEFSTAAWAIVVISCIFFFLLYVNHLVPVLLQDRCFCFTLKWGTRATSQSNFIHFHAKQECIPVGCVPPACYSTGGVSMTKTPQTETPGTETSPHPGQRPPHSWSETPPVDRQTHVKTSPSQT